MSKIIKGGFTSFQGVTLDNTGFKIKEKPKAEAEADGFGNITSNNEEIATTPEEIIALAKAQAKQILDDAQAQSLIYIKESRERVDAEVETSMQKGFEQGFEKGLVQGKVKGYEDGYQEGLDESDKLYEKNIAFMQGVIEGIDDAKHMMLKKYENSLSDVAFAMAKMIVKKELADNPQTLNTVIESAASSCKNQDFILVTLSQSGYNLIVGDSESVANTLHTYSDDIRFFVDNTMKETDCIIETPVGVINASVDVQLENINQAIKSHDNQEN